MILPPTLSSDRSHRKGIYLQYHDCPSHETPEHYPTQHVIAIQTQGIIKAERKGDRFKQEQIRPGDICLVPAHTRHCINSQGKQGAKKHSTGRYFVLLTNSVLNVLR